jgi:hypothetical protein
VEANSAGGQGSRRAVARSVDDDDDDDDDNNEVLIGRKMRRNSLITNHIKTDRLLNPRLRDEKLNV